MLMVQQILRKYSENKKTLCRYGLFKNEFACFFLRHDVIEQRFVFTFRKIISDRKKRFDTSFKI